MSNSLKGKSAIVTGAAVGLGNAFAKALAAQGVNVAVCDIRDEVDDLPTELEGMGVRAVGWRADVRDPAAVRTVVDGAIETFGKIDMLVSNAGVWGASVADDPLDKSIEDYDRIVGANLKGVFLFGRALIPHMIANGGGEILNISTDHLCTCGSPVELDHHDAPDCPFWNGKDPRPTGGGPAMDLYDAAKWGINGLLFGWCKALKPHNIRVNAFCMGATDSYMLRSFHNFDPPPEEVASWMKAEDIAQVMVDLFNEGPTGRTGENINFTMGHPVTLRPPLEPIYILKEELDAIS
jgi:NAD(P)-dependent dehydrogenase (short-subunit alcohol dehydrogenase family)